MHVAVFSDGCDAGGPAELGGHKGPYFERLEAAGSEALDELLRSEAAQGRPVRVVVYDTFMPWVASLTRRHGAACAAVLTQTCAVDIVYTHARAGRVPVPVRKGDSPLELPGLSSRLGAADVPTFLTDSDAHHPSLRDMLMNQFAGLDAVDHVFVNSSFDLEPQVSATRIRPSHHMPRVSQAERTCVQCQGARRMQQCSIRASTSRATCNQLTFTAIN